MTLFLIILISILFSIGIIVLFRLNNLRLSISNEINKTSLNALTSANSIVEPIDMETTLKKKSPGIWYGGGEINVVNFDEDSIIPEQKTLENSENIQNSNSDLTNKEDIHNIEELRKRALERIQDIRDSSYNESKSDFINEFESIPAYLRRNVEIKDEIRTSDIEDFISKYYVNAKDEGFIKMDDEIFIASKNSNKRKSEL